jgi:hypothetical protein
MLTTVTLAIVGITRIGVHWEIVTDMSSSMSC